MPQLFLYVLQGPDKGRQYDFTSNDSVPLGRASEQVPLTDLTVSRRHAKLEWATNGWVIADEGGANGVFINGLKISKPTKLKVGDQIRLGSSLLVFGAPVHSVSLAESDAVSPQGSAGPGDSSIISTVPSNDDSVILAAPEPSQVAMAHFRVLLQISTAIASVFDQQQLLNKVMDLVFEQLRADRGFIGLLDEATAKVVPVVVRYREEEQVGKIAVSQTIIQHVLAKNEGVLSSNAMTDQRFLKGKSVHNLTIRSAICVPIKGRDKNLGVLHIDSSVANYSYTPDQLRLLTAIGLQTGLAIEIARLYQESVRQERLAATGQTVASLSHSIKNILQGMRGGADVVDMGLKNNDVSQMKMGWSILQRNLDKVQALTMNMLAYSKPRSPNFELTNIPYVLGECMELIRSLAEDKKVTLLMEINKDQPPVPVDADGLHQAVLNLLTNALDAVESGRGVITLTSDVDAMNQRAVVEVQDNGIGIKPDDLNRIFQPFYSTKGQKGTGLGLAVTKKIIEEHGGQIQATSKVGGGTTFRILLPLYTSKAGDSGETMGPGVNS
ncbi:MAG TPA: ATP-binding protein [Phycisphaerae bacterium]|nr:ATP-binding protein [Phycisphaerae bacterium]